MKYKKIIISAVVITILFGIKVFAENEGIKIEKTVNNIEEQNIKEEDKIEKKEEEEKTQNKNIKVHVSGQVIRPGIVEIEENSRVADAIEIVGGLTNTANLDEINLAQILEDGMKIYVPNINEKVETEIKSTNTKNTPSIINLNTATIQELDTLPGIGESTANKIVTYREENGKFKNIEEIMDVSGIGEAKFESIKKLIEVK